MSRPVPSVPNRCDIEGATTGSLEVTSPTPSMYEVVLASARPVAPGEYGATTGARMAIRAIRQSTTMAIFEPRGNAFQPWKRSPGREALSSVERCSIRCS